MSRALSVMAAAVCCLACIHPSKVAALGVEGDAQARPANEAPAAVELTALLKAFLDGASRNDIAVHERFWADELIYTGSSGRRVGKADILRELRAAPSTKPGDPLPVYSAEEVHVQQYGDTAVVTFRLVARTPGHADASYYNTGTFVRRQGVWQVIAWQATRRPGAPGDLERDALAAHDAFFKALAVADTRALSALACEGFDWTMAGDPSMTLASLLGMLDSGQLRYMPLTAEAKPVLLCAEAAVIRGTVSGKRLVPGLGAQLIESEFRESYTLTLALVSGDWKVVAMQTGAAATRN